MTGQRAEDSLRADEAEGRRRGVRCKSSATIAIDRIVLARAVSFAGGNASFIVLLYILFQETHSASVVGVAALVTFAIPAVASPFAGWIGDSFDRRKVMVSSELLGVGCYVLASFVWRTPLDLVAVLVLAALAGSPIGSTTSAALPAIVDSEDELSRANSRLAAAGISGGLVGPLLGAGLVALSGPSAAFLFNAASFLVSGLLLASIRFDLRPSDAHEEGGRPSNLVAGFNYLRRHPTLRPLTIAYGCAFLGVGLTSPAEVALNSDLGGGAAGFAALTSSFAVGGIVGARLSGKHLRESSSGPTRVLPLSAAACGIGFLVVATAGNLPIVFLGMSIAGAAVGAWAVGHENLVQRATPDQIRSRVFAAGEAVYQCGIAIGTAAAGAIVASFGAAGTFRVAAAILLTASGLLSASMSASAWFSPKAKWGRRGRGQHASPPSPALATLHAGVGEVVSRAADQGTG